MMMTLFAIPILLSTILSSIILADDPCRFVHSNGVIDLTSLGQSDGNPRYKDRVPPTGSGYKYSYNPCKSFTEGSSCINVAGCQTSMDGAYAFVLGRQDTARWDAGPPAGGLPSVKYTDGEKTMEVRLECSRTGSETFEALGEDPVNYYKFRLEHLCACWNGCGGGPQPTPPTQPPPPRPTTSGGGGGGGGGGGSSGGTGGIVFIVLLLALLAVYFVGFGVFYRYRQDKSGAELIAHRTFWGSLPGLAKDGVVFVFQGIRSKCGGGYGSV